MTPLDHKGGGHTPRKFRLDKRDGMLAGVCAGIGNRFAIDATIVRLVFVAGALLGFGSFILVYLLVWLLAK